MSASKKFNMWLKIGKFLTLHPWVCLQSQTMCISKHKERDRERERERERGREREEGEEGEEEEGLVKSFPVWL